MQAQIKTIGTSGQISLGKEYAGRHVVIDWFDREAAINVLLQ